MSSYIKMDSASVRTLAEKCIVLIKEMRAKNLEVLISAERKKLEKSWLRRLLRLSVPNDTDIEARLEPWDIKQIKMELYGTLEIASSLLIACDNAETINITVTDLAELVITKNQLS